MSNYKLVVTFKKSEKETTKGTVSWDSEDFSQRDANYKLAKVISEVLKQSNWGYGVYMVDVQCSMNDAIVLYSMSLQYTYKGKDSTCSITSIDSSSIVNPLNFSEDPKDVIATNREIVVDVTNEEENTTETITNLDESETKSEGAETISVSKPQEEVEDKEVETSSNSSVVIEPIPKTKSKVKAFSSDKNKELETAQSDIVEKDEVDTDVETIFPTDKILTAPQVSIEMAKEYEKVSSLDFGSLAQDYRYLTTPVEKSNRPIPGCTDNILQDCVEAFDKAIEVPEEVKQEIEQMEEEVAELERKASRKPKVLFKVKTNKELGKMESGIIKAVKSLVYAEKEAHNKVFATEPLTVEGYLNLKRSVLLYDNCPDCSECAERLGMNYDSEDKCTPCSRLDRMEPQEAVKLLKQYSYQQDVVTNAKLLEALFGKEVLKLFKGTEEAEAFLESEYKCLEDTE